MLAMHAEHCLLRWHNAAATKMVPVQSTCMQTLYSYMHADTVCMAAPKIEVQGKG